MKAVNPVTLNYDNLVEQFKQLQIQKWFNMFLYSFLDNDKCTSVANCCNPPMLMGPSSEAYKLQPPTHSSDVGQTIPQVRPRGLSDRIARAAP